MKNDIGLKHIALELKISLVAVSRALKDYDDISELTKHKVRQKAIELGYVPRPVDKIKHKIKHKIRPPSSLICKLKLSEFSDMFIINKGVDNVKTADF